MTIQPTHDTKPQPQRAVVLHIEQPNSRYEGARAKPAPSSLELRKPEERLAEAVNLASALGLNIVHKDIAVLKKYHPKTLMGVGRAEELAEIVEAKDIDVVIVNAILTPSQQRNLEVAVDAKVVDRTNLILEIFADRAQTKAGKLQVELAQQLYQRGRLVRAWTHLERQRGGLGKTGGPGERQIELDRRMIIDRIQYIKGKLTEVEKERDLQRKSRERQGLPVVSLVGYTNAGKSTLFNALVSGDRGAETEDAFVKDMLFATLDPLMRKIKLPSGKECIISDTVGFVSDLPHELVKAFASTLEEVTLSSIILHVHDSASVESEAQGADVRDVLLSIEANEIPTISVANKIDMVKDLPAFLEHDAMAISALTGEGIQNLLEEIDMYLAKDEVTVNVEVPAADGKKLAWLHANGQVLKQEMEGETWHISVRLKEKDLYHVQ